MYEDTNKWARIFAERKAIDDKKRQEAIAKAAKTREYKMAKPKAITDLEDAWVRKGYKPKTWDDRKANGLTDFCLDWLAFHGHYAARINTGGTAMGATGAGGKEVLKWATSKSTKGVADIISCVCGYFCQFEIKAGKDRPRKDQLEQAELTKAAGGFYFFIHSSTELVEAVETIKNTIRK